MKNIFDKPAFKINGYLGVLIFIAILAIVIFLGNLIIDSSFSRLYLLWFLVPLVIILGISFNGFFVVEPNDSRIIVLFGKYSGTVTEDGFWFTNPFTKREQVSRRIRNFNSEKIKVNDLQGNPIEIAAVVVWRVVDSARASFDVENYIQFVAIQSETALRSLASGYAYDSSDDNIPSLRGSLNEVSENLNKQVQSRLVVAGVEVIEARINHLAYAPEIAQVMLRRQQAQAIVAARQKIVEGAVGMVEMALNSLSQQKIVELDEEKKATMVNNLLVALVSDVSVQPIINTGTLYQ
ncbi:MAG: hypothetical protein C0425_02570 [Chlorobiaceae bacterium]|nr:hypothetical protein [Chlorobiaceae bacterium]MBA4309205.1 hypothetical protein [Chlorobiaceae bacterium]